MRRTVSLSDLEVTLAAPDTPAPPRRAPTGLSPVQWALLAVNHLAPLALFLGLSLEGAGTVSAFFDGPAGHLALAGLWGGLTASVAAMLGLFVLANRAAPRGAGSRAFRALCLFLVWAMTTVLFTAPLCAGLFYGRLLVSALEGH